MLLFPDLFTTVVNEFLGIIFLKLSTENERVTKKYKKLARRNGQLEKELEDLKQQFRKNEFMQTLTRRSVKKKIVVIVRKSLLGLNFNNHLLYSCCLPHTTLFY